LIFPHISDVNISLENATKLKSKSKSGNCFFENIGWKFGDLKKEKGKRIFDIMFPFCISYIFAVWRNLAQEIKKKTLS
jgi:hypothetical protein